MCEYVSAHFYAWLSVNGYVYTSVCTSVFSVMRICSNKTACGCGSPYMRVSVLQCKGRDE